MTEHTDDGRDDLSTRGIEVTYEIDGDERPSEAVVRAVASITNTPLLDLEPLYDVIDPEHLDGMFDGPGGAAAGSSVTFRFNGCRVTVSPETVHVRRDAD